MEITYTPYELKSGVYGPQHYPSDYPITTGAGDAIVVANVAYTRGATSDMSIKLTNVTEFSDEPAQKGTFEFAGVFQNVPLFFMKVNKAATMSVKISCNAYSSLPIFLKYCNCWGKISLKEDEFMARAAVNGVYADIASVAREFYVTMEPAITEKPVRYGKTQFDITLKFTRVQV